MIKKNFFSAAEAYAAPACETLDVKVEGVMCQSPSYGDPGKAGSSTEDENYGGF